MLFLKIIIGCNKICLHALMFKKRIIFLILYIILGPLCPASLSLRFLQSPSFQQAQSALIGRTPQARVRNVMPLSIIASFSFQKNVKPVNNVPSFTISSSPRGEQSCVTDTVMMLMCVCKQAVVVMWPGTHTRAHTHTLCCDPLSLSLSLSHSHIHTHTHTMCKT